MYSKKEIYFTGVLALCVSIGLYSSQGITKASAAGQGTILTDGTHPPPPIQPPPPTLASIDNLQADGTHPPPPIQPPPPTLGSIDNLQAESMHSAPQSWAHDFRQVS